MFVVGIIYSVVNATLRKTFALVKCGPTSSDLDSNKYNCINANSKFRYNIKF